MELQISTRGEALGNIDGENVERTFSYSLINSDGVEESKL